MGRSAWLALAGLGWTHTGSELGNGTDLPVISKVAADASALGCTLGLITLSKAQAEATLPAKTLLCDRGMLYWAYLYLFL
jgi:hypothetical protein